MARHTVWLIGLLVLLSVSSGCSLRRMALNSVAGSLASSGDTFASDEDPELIRHAVPFSLKLVESLLAELPEHRGLLLTACSGFTQYAYAFVDLDAELLTIDEYSRSEQLRERARRLYLRAREYCIRGLEVRFPGIRAAIRRDPAGALAGAKEEDVPLLYWTGAAWGKAVSLSLDEPALAGDFPIVQALVRRALALDEGFNDGALHEAMISIEAVIRGPAQGRQFGAALDDDFPLDVAGPVHDANPSAAPDGRRLAISVPSGENAWYGPYATRHTTSPRPRHGSSSRMSHSPLFESATKQPAFGVHQCTL